MKEIPLTKGRMAIVDDEEFERLNQYKWHFCPAGTGYARRSAVVFDKKIKVYMTQDLISTPKGFQVYFKNDQTLDCRRENLYISPRAVVRAQKTSQFRGVSWAVTNKKWKVSIGARSARVHLGFFDDEEKAAMAYDEYARKYHGIHACLNFPKRMEAKV